MALFLMPEETAARLKDRLLALAETTPIQIQRASDLRVQIVFTKDELRDFAAEPGDPILVAADDQDAFRAAIPERDNDRRYYTQVRNERALSRYDPFTAVGRTQSVRIEKG
ncbi:hypothetical protein AADZ90_006670 [Aestuariibius sp. 2305UL40-4]|uniref:hypothetical protein n=1 Tax=Aestuariibius violaceus TaxID=3234132 RepID=UPI00345E8C21